MRFAVSKRRDFAIFHDSIIIVDQGKKERHICQQVGHLHLDAFAQTGTQDKRPRGLLRVGAPAEPRSDCSWRRKLNIGR